MHQNGWVSSPALKACHLCYHEATRFDDLNYSYFIPPDPAPNLAKDFKIKQNEAKAKQKQVWYQLWSTIRRNEIIQN